MHSIKWSILSAVFVFFVAQPADAGLFGHGRPPALFDNFTRANGVIGKAQSGQQWIQIPVSQGPQVVLATISSNKLTTVDSGQATTASYSGIYLGSKTQKMAANVSFGSGTAGGAAVLVANPNGLGTIANIVASSLHIVFTDVSVDLGTFASGVYTVRKTFIYGTPLAHDGTIYSVGWSLSGSTLTITMPDGTLQVWTDANFSSQDGAYAQFEEFWTTGQTHPSLSYALASTIP